MIGSKPRILLTGSTGLIGGELLPLLAAQANMVWALIRTSPGQSAEQRLTDRQLRSDRSVPANSVPVAGNLCRQHCGIASNLRQDITRECHIIVHAGGSTSFADSDCCKSNNIYGTENLITLAKQCHNLKALFFVSSASVCLSPGSSTISEDLRLRGYANHYVASKRVAERLMKNSGLPVVVLRPSIVLSAGMDDPIFARQILWAIPVAITIGCLPLTGKERLDMVPVDYTAQAIAGLVERHKRLNYNCYHISAGPVDCTTTAMIRSCCDCDSIPMFDFITRQEWTRRKVRNPKRRLMDAFEHYLPFIRANVAYDNSRLRAELGQDMPHCAHFSEYGRQLLRMVSLREALTESFAP